MAKTKWTRWVKVVDIPEKDIPKEPGAYIIATRSAINRAIGADSKGTLGIGESTNLRRRLLGFYRCATGQSKRGHRAGSRYRAMKLYRTFPVEDLWCKWITSNNKDDAYQIEGDLLIRYAKKHGELPPLNYKSNLVDGDL